MTAMVLLITSMTTALSVFLETSRSRTVRPVSQVSVTPDSRSEAVTQDSGVTGASVSVISSRMHRLLRDAR